MQGFRCVLCFLICLWLANHSLASQVRWCDYLFNAKRNPEPVPLVPIKFLSGNDKEKQTYVRVFAETDQLLEGTLSRPLRVDVSFVPSPGKEYITHEGKGVHHMRIVFQRSGGIRKPKAPRKDRRSSKHPVHSQAVGIHEYAHAYFHDEFSEFQHKLIEKTFAKLEYHQNEARRLLKRLEPEMVKYVEQYKKVPAEPESHRISFEKRHAALRSKYYVAKLLVEEPDYQVDKTIKSNISAYNEFFADAVAAVQTGNRAAMGNALFFTGQHNIFWRRRNFDGRTFTKAQSNLFLKTTSDPHNAFFASRQMLGKFFPSKDSSLIQRRAFVKKLVSVIRSEMNKLQSRPLTLSLYELDQHLSQAIQAAFLSR